MAMPAGASGADPWEHRMAYGAADDVRDLTVGEAGLRVIVLHGAHGGPDTNWFPWLDAELTREEIEVVRPRFPTPQGQSLPSWLEVVDTTVASLTPASTILVGHSLGVAMALRLAERATAPLVGLFLAAGFVGALGLSDYDSINESFFAQPFDWVGIRRRMGTCRCWAGDNDPYVPLSRSQDIADRLRAPLEVISAGGHLNSESGFTAFPHLRDAVLVAGGRDGH